MCLRLLGAAALGLASLARSIYVPGVAEDGLVTIPDRYRHSDGIPTLALHDGELVERDTTFATFAPRQYETAPPASVTHFKTVAARVASCAKEVFIAQTFEQDAASMRIPHAIPNYPGPGKMTYFNLRPLVLLRYDSGDEHIRASTLANALTQAEQVLKNPVTVVQGEEGFEALNEQWQACGYELGDSIEHILHR